MLTPEIDQNKCDGCGLCVSVCWQHCLLLVDDVVVLVDKIDCDWCTQCEAVCATGAISCPFEIVLG